jgi:hypothetical protein
MRLSCDGASSDDSTLGMSAERVELSTERTVAKVVLWIMRGTILVSARHECSAAVVYALSLPRERFRTVARTMRLSKHRQCRS